MAFYGIFPGGAKPNILHKNKEIVRHQGLSKGLRWTGFLMTIPVSTMYNRFVACLYILFLTKTQLNGQQHEWQNLITPHKQ